MKFSTRSIAGAACSLLLGAQSANAIPLDVNDENSIRSAASTVAYKMMEFYPGNKTGGIPGLLGDPYYWWEAGAMFGSLIDYWYYTGDASYNNVTSQAMLFQTGPDNNYMPPNQSKSLGNDDQCFWGLAAMTAAEANFPNPPADQPQWLALAQAVFNTQIARWDTTTCNGGLRWQIFTFNNGYNYKNSISNGCFFNLGVRLAAYTGNTTYSDWAIKAYDWTEAVGLMSSTYQFFDGTDDTQNCTSLNHIQWTYNSGVFLYGAAMMYNITNGNDTWKQRATDIWNASSVFFTGTNNQVMYEVACEPGNNCDTDQLSFKAYLSRWMAASIKVAPFLEPMIMPFLITSAEAAAQTCVGGSDGITCGEHWTVSGWDNSYGVGQQMSALEVISGLLINQSKAPLTNTTGGTSVGNPAAGTGTDTSSPTPLKPITTADRAGAGIVTVIILVGLLGGAWWMIA